MAKMQYTVGDAVSVDLPLSEMQLCFVRFRAGDLYFAAGYQYDYRGV